MVVTVVSHFIGGLDVSTRGWSAKAPPPTGSLYSIITRQLATRVSVANLSIVLTANPYPVFFLLGGGRSRTQSSMVIMLLTLRLQQLRTHAGQDKPVEKHSDEVFYIRERNDVERHESIRHSRINRDICREILKITVY